MQYHIQTDPIWEAFKSGCDCPLCEIYSRCEARLSDQYLNEAVMEPEYRVEVNKYGFCSDHLKKLFAGKNKLGLSLQLQTRIATVRSDISPVSSYKQALKQAATLDKTIDTCVICNSLNEMTERYACTIAQMFACEEEFRTVFQKSNGFCMPHYVLLLRQSKKAGSMTVHYLNELASLQNRTSERVSNDLDRFAQMFDYRNAGSAVRPDPETVPAAIRKLKGRIL